MRQKKRFIAGASCPECKAMDTMMLYREHDVEKVECVECGHKMAQPDNAVQASTRGTVWTGEGSGRFEQVFGVFKPGD